MKRTLKKESKVREIAGREAIGTAEPSVHSTRWPAGHLWLAAGHTAGFCARTVAVLWRVAVLRPTRRSAPTAPSQTTRLETRTKEFSKLASATVTTLRRAAKAKTAPPSGGAVHAASSEREARWPGASRLSTLAETR
jgi:hypothetical protein